MGNLAAAYDIMVHCNGNKIKIPNVDSTGYMYISLLLDVTKKALSKMPGNVNMFIDTDEEVVDDRAVDAYSEDSDTNFSDFEDNEALVVVPDTESEEENDPIKQVMRHKIWIYNSKDEIDFQKGQLFTNVNAFRVALKDYIIQKGFPILRLKNKKSRVTAVCDVEGCQWRIHTSPVADSVTFQIKSYQPEHICVMDKQCAETTSDWMAKKLVSVIRDHPNMTSKEVEAELLKYAELIRKHNPNSICKIYYDRPNLLVEPAFLRIFVSFRAQKLEFLEGCRPFVGFDGCFLKGSFGGVLLTAVALDANNIIFPLPFAVAECESKDTWRWFFYYFFEFFGPFDHSKPLTFMSDRQKGLNLAYEEMIPEAVKRHCCRHRYSNFKSQFSGILISSFFWKAAQSYDAIGHNDAMVSIKDININA
ncbi:uncharacterized protein LOC113752574 [Coffea eugenioides]|uniref:uncharacterized protein LOC113752574 n=1 Tax=Coffea eugenioides TaxID=49369 RepID=UPI000F606469|nr:uncharacterized protein LOC113752574 [Coffea eugenioides]